METELRILLIKEGEWWTAIALDLNLSAQGRSLLELGKNLVTTMESARQICEHEGLSFSDYLQEVPSEKYGQLYKSALPLGWHVEESVRQVVGASSEDVRMIELNSGVAEAS